MTGFLARLFGSRHDAFAAELARDFIDSCPPDEVLHPQKRKDSVRLVKTMNRVYDQARGYRGSQRPGWYGRARIGNELMWRLRDAGYDELLVDRVTNDVLRCLAGREESA
jgi:hypothetical protein